jgi:F0F1-type ATP synthase assembly protein I
MAAPPRLDITPHVGVDSPPREGLMKGQEARGFELLSVGITLVVATGLGYLAGNWLDGKLHTSPWFGIVGVLLGAAGGFVQLFRVVEGVARSDGNEHGH